jgi:hypothetical protein
MTIKNTFSSPRDPETVPEEWFLERYRNWRKDELTATDWTQLPDSPADADAYATYRQALRDLPTVDDFSNAELPVRP